jgi:hypothetical protein
MLQMKIVQATMSGDLAAAAKLDQEYRALMQMVDQAMHQGLAAQGYVRIDAAQEAEVVALLDRWDQCLAEGRIEDAEKLIPERGTQMQTYKHFSQVFGNERMTRHPGLRPDVVDKSLEYEYGQDGGLSYRLYTDGERSEYTAEITYERNGDGFRLLLDGINY